MRIRPLGSLTLLALSLFVGPACKEGDGVIHDSEDLAAGRDGAMQVRDGGTSEKRAFITQKKFRGDLIKGGGLAGADAACAAAARDAQLGGTFKAWASTSAEDAIDRILDVGPWYDLSGAKLFADRASLMTTPQMGIQLDERGQFLPSDRIWTGTRYGGTFDSLDRGCKDWTSSSMSDLGKIGQVGRADGAAWTAYSATTCDQEGHLLCFAQ